MGQKHDAFSNLNPRDLRAQNRNNKRQRTVTSLESGSTDSSEKSSKRPRNSKDKAGNLVDSIQVQEEEEVTNSPPTELIIQNDVCQRTLRHPLHTISSAAPSLPIERWAALQDNSEDLPSNMVQVPKEELKPCLPTDLIVLRDKSERQRILVPRCQRIALTMAKHETMLHVKGNCVHHELSRSYFWPNMSEQIKALYDCIVCKQASIQPKNFSATFRQADHKDMPLPRQAYGIDFCGHEKGEILVAFDLCTREGSLWFLPNRKQENVARALLTGLILQKGVPLIFRNDEASEFVKGVEASMNRYLGITQVTTASHNPRSNAVVERFMQHLNVCLTKCDDTQYNNMQGYLPAIAFAHNTSFNSAINCTPFEAGHGLQARTITEARAGPRLQIVAEGGMNLLEADKNWEKLIFSKLLNLAERLASEAQRQSQWHKRMNSHNLNQSGSRVEDKGLSPGEPSLFL
jgi:hypothetical protein